MIKKYQNSTYLNIIIIDGEGKTTYNFCRCFDHSKVRIFVISRTPNSALSCSSYIEKYIYLDHAYTRADLIKFEQIIAAYKIDLIYALTDPGNLYVAHFLTEFSTLAKVAVHPAVETFKTVSDKLLFNDFCLGASIPVPETLSLTESDQLLSKGKVILKPIHAFGGHGIKVFDSKAALLKFKGTLTEEEIDGYLIQQYVSGYDVTCNILAKEGKLLAYCIQKGFLAGKDPYGPYEGLEFLPDDKVLNLTKKLLAEISWSGVGHIDLRYDEAGELFLIEMNGRYWNSIVASKLVAAVNFPLLHLQISLNEQVNFGGFKKGAYITAKKFTPEIVKKLLRRSDKAIKFKHSNLYLMSSDPFYHLAQLAKRVS